MRAPRLVAGFVAGGLLAAGHAAAQTPAVLSQPALITPRATHALMLGVALAGDRLISVGERGIVLLSDDHGAVWRQAANVPVAVTLTAVRFASPREGWAVGHLGVILHTSDGGATWERQLDGVRAAALMRDAAAAAPAGETHDAALAAAEQLVSDGPDKPFLDLAIGDDAVVAVGAYGLAVRSTDGGHSWRAATDIADPQGLHLYALAHASTFALIAGEQGFVAVQHGEEMFAAAKMPSSGTFFGATILPGGTGLVFGLGGALARSDDAGQSWTSAESGISGAITCAALLPDGRVLLGGDNGELSRGDAGGREFHTVALAPRIPVTAMLVDGPALILAGPTGPRRVLLASLDPAS